MKSEIIPSNSNWIVSLCIIPYSKNHVAPVRFFSGHQKKPTVLFSGQGDGKFEECLREEVGEVGVVSTGRFSQKASTSRVFIGICWWFDASMELVCDLKIVGPKWWFKGDEFPAILTPSDGNTRPSQIHDTIMGPQQKQVATTQYPKMTLQGFFG